MQLSVLSLEHEQVVLFVFVIPCTEPSIDVRGVWVCVLRVGCAIQNNSQTFCNFCQDRITLNNILVYRVRETASY